MSETTDTSDLDIETEDLDLTEVPIDAEIEQSDEDADHKGEGTPDKEGVWDEDAEDTSELEEE